MKQELQVTPEQDGEAHLQARPFHWSLLSPWGFHQGFHQMTDELSTAFGLLAILALSCGY